MRDSTGNRLRALTSSILKGLVVAAVSLVFTLALLEIAARALHLGTGGFWEPHPLYGWRNIPNAAGWESCYGECEVYVEINSRGLRDLELGYEKPESTRRILLLGDSMTAGMQVPLDRTFTKLLEAQLNAGTSGDGGAWEVINGAVNAFGTDNELLFYRLEGSQYEPDIVLLGMYLANDVYNNHRELELSTGGSEHKPYFVLTEDGELELQNFPAEATDTFFIRVGSFLKRNFQLPRFIAQTLNLRAEVPAVLRPLVELAGGRRGVPAEEEAETQDAGETVDICTDEYAPIIEEAWIVTKALILQLRREIEANGAQLGVLVIPASPQTWIPEDGTSWYCDQPNQELAAFLEAEGIPYLDLLPEFRQHMLAGGSTLYYEKDFHMNGAGHRLTGDLLYQFLQKTPSYGVDVQTRR